MSEHEKQDKHGTPNNADDLNEQLPHAWDRPSPEAKAAAEPAKRAVKDAIKDIKTPEQAEEVARDISSATSGMTEEDIREAGGAEPQPGEAIAETKATSGSAKPQATLVEAAKQVAGSSGETRAALEEVLQEATNPEQEGVEEPETEQQRNMLREALLKQMKPLQAIDARLYLAINHLPHSHLSNQLMYTLTAVMNAGFGWVVGLMVAATLDHDKGRKALLQIVPPLWFATMTVEYPIKYYFRRKRPFIDIVQAIAVGKKPGTFSFPSGHSAAAFAGAWLLRRHYPQLTPLWYTIAALVAFSRMYLGAHYPGDVLSGAISGTVLAEATRWMLEHGDEIATEPTLRERVLEQARSALD